MGFIKSDSLSITTLPMSPLVWPITRKDAVVLCNLFVGRARPDLVVGLKGQDKNANMVLSVMHRNTRNTLLV